MSKFRKKPVVIEAEQFSLDSPHRTETDTWGVTHRIWACGVYEETEGMMYEKGLRYVKPRPTRIVIDTLEGQMDVVPGEWIITGIKGEKYSIKPDIFAATYEPVDEGEGGDA